jgi:hypothetical protein
MSKRRIIAAVAFGLALAGPLACGKKKSKPRNRGPAVEEEEPTEGGGEVAKNTPPDGPEFGVARTSLDRLRIGDKFYVASVLSQVFGPDAETIVGPMIRQNTVAFGGPCDQLGRIGYNHCGGKASGSQAAIIPSTMATREGYRMRACEAIAQNFGAVAFAVEQIDGADVDSEPTTKQLRAAYDLFYPGIEAPSGVIAALGEVADAADGPSNGWRYVFLTLCLSPDWQLL